MSQSDAGFQAALEEARKGLEEGGVPIGAALVDKDGKILGRGHNMRMQKGSTILHAETAALEDAGRMPASAYKGTTMYTTLSPCAMCTGACLLYNIPRIVLGENETFLGEEELLGSRGVEVINLKSEECRNLMKKAIEERPDDWWVVNDAWMGSVQKGSQVLHGLPALLAHPIVAWSFVVLIMLTGIGLIIGMRILVERGTVVVGRYLIENEWIDLCSRRR